MIAKGVSLSILEDAAQKVGVALDVTPLNSRGDRFRVKVNSAPTDANYRTATAKDGRTYPVRYADERGDAPYQRESASMFSGGRRVSAVCWHGFRDFFRAVYASTPGVVFVTGLDTWRGSEDFEKRFPESGHKNIGSQMAPVSIVDACRCPDRGMAG